MTHNFSKLTLALAVAASPVFADDNVEKLTVLGSTSTINHIPGSAHYLDSKTLAQFAYTDVMRALVSVPGVYVTEEDGYGLRPNIGMRGTGQDRSDKLVIMEDGVLAAPAPYTAPAAYYFPTMGRMQSVEVLKGTSSVRFGPRTTGGVINLNSVDIPEQAFAGRLNLALGTDNFNKEHLVLGGSTERFGAVVEGFRYAADGFKSLPGGQDTGFEKHDLLGKFSATLTEDGRHHLLVKLAQAEERSDETYIGITDQDFANDPLRRYAASQLDVMNTDHDLIQVSHSWLINNDSSLVTTVYRNEFARNWYKADRIGGKSLSGGGLALASEFEANPEGELAVRLKNNNRQYLSQGIQTEYSLSLGEHQLVLGARLHEDEEDRFQWTDNYLMDASLAMRLDSAGVPGTDTNRLSSADALALYAQGSLVFDNLTINAGLRYEDVKMKREDWNKAPDRLQAPSVKQHDLSLLNPMLGMSYQFGDNWVLIGSVQRGVAPPSPGNEQTAEEKSLSTEAGVRYRDSDLAFEAIAFSSEYDNMHGNCTASQGCDDANIGNQYNAGEVDIQGFEMLVSQTFQADNLLIPVSLTYTYTKGEFQNSFESDNEIWGSVQKGDELPYLPDHQLLLQTGLQSGDWQANLSLRYQQEMRTNAGQGEIADQERVKAQTVVDASVHYQLADNQRLSLLIDNLLDREYAATRVHGGLQPGKPRYITLGYELSF
ncbi:TonB-dependent receptor family protein [Bowmanella pacifica]|uniref:TonB-dependent receptor n=1 Tax=Bowmanella pacifica TaxID=502051 RepID=A0A917Z1F1_9ALTE|nr:TonB-dependent receptor [Bowmanella pacifica]GGO72485.1 TonB-dependent receptor [Bowmanella pacifica]